LDKLLIQGPTTLSGDVEISGAKNAALPILMCSLLSSDVLELSNLPDLHDIKTTKKLLQAMGVEITDGKNTVLLRAKSITSYEAPLLSRFGEARVSMPGGCAIGSRPVDIHIKGLEAMGALIKISHGYIDASCAHLPGKRLQGAKIFMDQVTVTGTENLMMAAVLADGITTLDNSAREPEIVDLGMCLKKMGAKIEGLGSDRIVVEGVRNLHSANHTIMFDRIEAGTYLVAAAMTGGKVVCRNVDPTKMEAIIQKLLECGVHIESTKESITIKSDKKIKAVNITTAPYPGFPTDMQAQFMALNTVADGVGEITESIFENRFMHVQELQRMGAVIDIKHNTAIIRGEESLEGAKVMATDLRASAGLVLAGLVAKGTTQIDRIYHLDRGYEDLEAKLNRLGANIKRVS